MNMDIASEFLEMAARLIYIKTAMLLPRHEEADKLKNELIGELLEYRVCQMVAEELAGMAEYGQFTRKALKLERDKTYRRKHETAELLSAYLAAVGRGKRKLPPPVTAFRQLVSRRIVSVSSRIVYILRKLWDGNSVAFASLFEESRDRSDLVATFLAVLELMKAHRVSVSGTGAGAEIVMVKGSVGVGE
ncbi:MAG TPA: serine protease, partial [Ruminococcaceae bacterium]|nr:serine protease [Oscillospiraceae bacterium]